MKRYLYGIVAVLAYLSLMTGCNGFDKTLLLIQPDTVVTSGTFDVVIADAYLYLDTGTTVSKRVERDSLHLLVGLPQSWEVAGARAAVVKDMGIGTILALLQSGMTGKEVLEQLAQKYLNEAVEITADGGLEAALSGKKVTAHGRSLSDKINVNVDEVKQWKGFSAPVNIVLEKGSRPDTIVPIDSAMSFALKSGLMADSIATMIKQIKNDPFLGRFVPDTMGISVVPIVIFLKIKASGTEGVDTLFYFTKTDAMNPPPSSAGPLLDKYLSGISGMEAGDMVYAPVTVAGVSSVRREKKRFDSEGIGVVTDPSSGAVRIDLGRRFDNKPISVRVYSLHGSLIRTLTPAAGAKSILWDGADERGRTVVSGSYFIRIDGATGSAVIKSVRL